MNFFFPLARPPSFLIGGGYVRGKTFETREKLHGSEAHEVNSSAADSTKDPIYIRQETSFFLLVTRQKIWTFFFFSIGKYSSG